MREESPESFVQWALSISEQDINRVTIQMLRGALRREIERTKRLRQRTHTLQERADKIIGPLTRHNRYLVRLVKLQADRADHWGKLYDHALWWAALWKATAKRERDRRARAERTLQQILFPQQGATATTTWAEFTFEDSAGYIVPIHTPHVEGPDALPPLESGTWDNPHFNQLLDVREHMSYDQERAWKAVHLAHGKIVCMTIGRVSTK